MIKMNDDRQLSTPPNNDNNNNNKVYYAIQLVIGYVYTHVLSYISCLVVSNKQIIFIVQSYRVLKVTCKTSNILLKRDHYPFAHSVSLVDFL